MHFMVVSQFKEIQIYTRRASPEDALSVAERRRAMGADSVLVYDHDWQFISAKDLADRIGRQKHATTASDRQRGSGGVTWTVQAQPSPVASASEPGSQTRRRVRVFKASKLHDDHS